MTRSAGPHSRTWLPLALLTTTLAAPAAQALVFGERERTCPDGGTYSDYYGGTYTGDPSNPFAPFRVVIPDRGWNGKLLAYARGTGSAIKVNQAGIPLDVDGNPLVDPASQPPLLGFTPLNNALPEITPDGLVLPANPDAFEEELVCARRYAAVVSDYKPDFDFLLNGKLAWVVEDGVRDIGLAVLQARRLVLATQGRWPRRTILLGRSQGSLVALRYAEERSPLVDGVITACTVGAGASRSWDSAVDAALAIDVAFQGLGGWPWGREPGDVGDVNDDVVFAKDVAPVIQAWFQDPTAFARLEFVRRVSGLPLAGFYPFNPASINPALPDVPGYPQFSWLGTTLLFATEVKADLEARAGGAAGQNLDHFYGLPPADRQYLQALGVPVDLWLAQMNARRTYGGSPEGRAYTASYRDFTFDGLLPPRPMLSVHTTTDGLVLPSQETELRETLDATGRPAKSQQLRQTFIEANGHCSFTQAEWTVALEAMEKRLDSGVWPGDAFFPHDPDNGLRFNSAFDAGQYPQPASP
jgi:pimeloyl-ACP methyl ester carboxylesterase